MCINTKYKQERIILLREKITFPTQIFTKTDRKSSLWVSILNISCKIVQDVSLESYISAKFSRYSTKKTFEPIMNIMTEEKI